MKKEYVMTVCKVDLIPSSILLSVVDANLRLEMGSDRLLANLLETLKPDYDYIIVGYLSFSWHTHYQCADCR